ncbi:sigma factor-like helix-turn-helix DNA-binding protein, partial [Listeria monocytogenes]
KTFAEKELGELEREMIKNLLEKLTKSEKECYLLSKQCLFSYSEIAEYLNISKKSVDNYISRAKNKIDKQKKKSLLVNAYMSEKNEVNK